MWGSTRHRALVYDILSLTTAITGYVIGLLGAQIAANLQQTTQFISGVSFITTHVAYVSTDKTKLI